MKTEGGDGAFRGLGGADERRRIVIRAPQSGRVVSVSADRMVEEGADMAYSAVRIGIAEEQIARLGGLELRAGMPAEVFINTGERTALSYLMKPSSDAIRRALREG